MEDLADNPIVGNNAGSCIKSNTGAEEIPRKINFADLETQRQVRDELVKLLEMVAALPNEATPNEATPNEAK